MTGQLVGEAGENEEREKEEGAHGASGIENGELKIEKCPGDNHRAFNVMLGCE
jgi:hypothetical protein